jgi:phage shock protein A
MSASAILKLQAAGFSADQVTALADLIDTQAASTADLEGVEHRLEMKIGAVKADLEGIEHRLAINIGAVKADLEGVEHRLETKIGEIERRMEVKIETVKAEVLLLKWMMGFILAFQVALFAKLFMH